MTSMKLAKLCFAIVTIATCLPAQPSSAGNFAYLSATGGGLACTAAAPCATFLQAIASLLPSGGRILCLDPVADTQSASLALTIAAAFDIDCPAGSWNGAANAPVLNLILLGPLKFTFRNMAFNGVGGATNAIKVSNNGGGTLIFENCVFDNFSGIAFDIEPTGPLNLVMTNSRISNAGSGILLKPAAGGSIKATLDHVTITGSVGGGIKADATNGVVDLDVSDSEISDNGGNGINAVASGPNQNIVSIKNSVIARNGAAGVQSNGANAGVLMATTLLDQNVSGALSVVAGGNLFTYGNNQVVGSQGSNFTSTAALK